MNETYNDRIDRALRVLGSAEPDAGMEDRIHAGLARAEARSKTPRFFRMPQLVVMFAAAGTVCVVIVAGSVAHSHHLLPVAPGLHLPGESQAGVGAASAARVAAQPVAASPKGRPRSVRKTVDGRAIISPEAKKKAGLPVPKPLADEDQPASPRQP
ncbi:MAG: hypothetical protein ACRD3F_12625 [Acidobacteriaceae bacterium]